MNESIQQSGTLGHAWQVLEALRDPEIPVLGLLDLGVIRSIDLLDGGAVRVSVSPTYSGCPASAVIRGSIVEALREAGFERVDVIEVLSPPWSSDWISGRGRDKLREYGIAPPAESVSNLRELLGRQLQVACPRCGSSETRKISEFGSTPCKAHYACVSCLEPFDYFKCI